MKIILISLLAIFLYLYLSFLNQSEKKENIKIEENVVMNGFANYVVAKTYDMHCNKPSLITNDIKNPVTINFTGHAQTLTARAGSLQLVKNRAGESDEVSLFIFKLEKSISDQAQKMLIQEGCDSLNGLKAKKSFLIFSETSPSEISDALDKEITVKGGTVTLPNKLDRPLSAK